MKTTTYLLAVALVATLNACLVVENPYTRVAPGPWRAILQLDPKPPGTLSDDEMMDANKVAQARQQATKGQLPFNFEVVYTSDTAFYIEIINASERIKVTDITFGRDRATGKDTIVIDFPVYDSYIKAICNERIMQGEWVVKNRENYAIPFTATHGQVHRFTNIRERPVADISGRWEALFSTETDSPYPAIGEFKQKDNYLEGTFLTETGDYRYLQGTVQGRNVLLSCFDGSHAFLFEAKLQPDSTLLGSFRSGKHYKTIWKALKNDMVALADPDTLTYLKAGYNTLDFSFESPEGKTLSLSSEAYKDKVKLVQILGTWCPNCRDEANFLKRYLEEHPSEELVVMGLAFERYRDKARADAAIVRYRDKLGLNYDLAYAGYYNKKEAAEALPMLNHILSYPTLIFVDKKNQVRKIHTGFSGPATSTYPVFAKEFNDFVQLLLAE